MSYIQNRSHLSLVPNPQFGTNSQFKEASDFHNRSGAMQRVGDVFESVLQVGVSVLSAVTLITAAAIAAAPLIGQ